MNTPTKIALLVFVIIMAMLNSGCSDVPSFDTQQYHFDENMKLISQLQKKTNYFLDSSRKCYLNGQYDKVQTLCDSTTKYNDIANFINQNTSIPK